jgi:hypothetical protein
MVEGEEDKISVRRIVAINIVQIDKYSKWNKKNFANDGYLLAKVEDIASFFSVLGNFFRVNCYHFLIVIFVLYAKQDPARVIL